MRCCVLLLTVAVQLLSAAEIVGLNDRRPRQRLVEKPLFVTFTQHKYNLNPLDSYFERWIDRPLFLNPALKDSDGLYGGVGDTPLPGKAYQSFADYCRSGEIAARYGIDAFHYTAGYYGETSFVIYDYSARAADGVKISSMLNGARPQMIDRYIETIVNHPNHLKINGKFVVEADLSAAMRQRIVARHGDRFIFFTQAPDFERYVRTFDRGGITDADRERAREDVRAAARRGDGISVRSTYKKLDNGYRRMHRKFTREFALPIVIDVLNEPEFQKKYLNVYTSVGHENTYLRGYMSGSDGTKTLRFTVETALAANADMVTLFEWDEVNENTHIQPTVYNGMSTMRIIRHYTGKPSGERSELPDICVSYRRILSAGEKLEVEILNIPASGISGVCRAQVELCDPAGKTVRTLPPVTLDLSKLTDKTISVPSEELAEHAALFPVVTLQYGGRTTRFAAGLHPIELRGVYNYDYGFVKQPLRDLLPVRQAMLKVTPTADKQVKHVDFSIDTDEEIAYVELMEGNSCIYVHGDFRESSSSVNRTDQYWNLPLDTPVIWRENPDYYVLQFSVLAVNPTRISGTVKFNTPELPVKHSPGKWGRGNRDKLSVSGGTIKLENYFANIQHRSFFVAIPRPAAGEVTCELDIPGVVTRKLPLKEILDKQSLTFSGADNTVTLGVHRFLRQYDHPAHLNRKECRFAVDLIQGQPGSVIFVQAVSVSGRQWRSRPVPVGESSGTTRISAFSETTGKPVTVTVDRNKAPRLEFKADDSRGTVLAPGEYRCFWAVRGGAPVNVTRLGGNESDRSLPYAPGRKSYPDSFKSSAAPEVCDGVIRFTRPGQFIAIPQGVIPRRCAYRIGFEIKPEEVEKRQFLFGHFGRNPGGLYEVVLEWGILKAMFINDREQVFAADSGFRLEPGRWNKVEIIRDLDHLAFEIDGRRSKLFPAPRPGWFDMPAAFGGFGDSWFIGELRNLFIDYNFDGMNNTTTGEAKKL